MEKALATEEHAITRWRGDQAEYHVTGSRVVGRRVVTLSNKKPRLRPDANNTSPFVTNERILCWITHGLQHATPS